MSMRQEIDVTVSGQKLHVVTSPVDYAKAEREIPKHFNGLGMADVGNIETMIFLAWAAVTRKHLFEGTYAAFTDALEDIDLTGEAPLGETA